MNLQTRCSAVRAAVVLGASLAWIAGEVAACGGTTPAQARDGGPLLDSSVRPDGGSPDGQIRDNASDALAEGSTDAPREGGARADGTVESGGPNGADSGPQGLGSDGGSDGGMEAGLDSGADGANDSAATDAGPLDQDGGSHDSGADSGSFVTQDAGGSDGAPVSCPSTCNAVTGLCAPLETCSTTNACTVTGGATVTTEITLPTCATTSGSARPSFDDGPPIQWTDSINGDARAACVYVPTTASAAAKVPLVVFLHGAQGSADDVYNSTSLRSKALAEGFAIASVQGRNLHWVGGNPAGAHWDEFYRDLGAPSTNPDIRSVDHLVDTLVSQGNIDPTQIHLMGWSNGAFMSQLYGVARFTTATPGGNHVGSVAVFAGGDPFSTFDASDPTCGASPYPRSAIPIFSVHRNCDALVGCNAAQQSKFSLEPGYDVEDWLALAATSAGLDDPMLQDLILTGMGASASACLGVSLCSELLGAANHLSWPDGVADKSGMDWEPTMLDFLSSHPGG